MDRQIVYPTEILLDSDLLSMMKNQMVALGYVLQATLGAAPIVDGLAITATTVPSLTVNVGPGMITSANVIDATAYGSLGSDAVLPLVKQGINTAATPLTFTAPTTSGQSRNYLVQVNFLEADTTNVVLPYYDAANPALPFTGAGGLGTSQPTQRRQTVQIQLKAGAPATTGTQATPSVDAGWTGLAVFTINFGQTAVTNTQCLAAALATAPYIPAKLGPGFNPGFSRRQIFAASATFVVPAGVTSVRATVIGGGAGAGGSTAGQGSSGGGAGGLSQDILSVTPGASMTVIAGAGGTGGTTGTAGTNGGASSFSSLTATGGQAGSGGSSVAPGLGGVGSGASGTNGLNMSGECGGGVSGTTVGGRGGSAPMGFGAGGIAATTQNAYMNGLDYGSGGGGGYSGSALTGGNGGHGVVIIEY